MQVALPYYKRLARHFESAKNYEEAERFFIRAKLPGDAVEMYTRANKWDGAHRVMYRPLCCVNSLVL
jgi:intraflagellar transport protein 172